MIRVNEIKRKKEVAIRRENVWSIKWTWETHLKILICELTKRIYQIEKDGGKSSKEDKKKTCTKRTW